MIDMAKDVQKYLQAQDVIDGNTQWPSVRGAFHDLSDRLIGIASDVGPAPEVPADDGAGSAAFKWPAVQVRVRGAKDDTRDLIYAKAASIYDLLNGYGGDLNGTHYARVRALGSGFAEFIDERERINLTVSYQAMA